MEQDHSNDADDAAGVIVSLHQGGPFWHLLNFRFND
jgi:hypothetical protein